MHHMGYTRRIVDRLCNAASRAGFMHCRLLLRLLSLRERLLDYAVDIFLFSPLLCAH